MTISDHATRPAASSPALNSPPDLSNASPDQVAAWLNECVAASRQASCVPRRAPVSNTRSMVEAPSWTGPQLLRTHRQCVLGHSVDSFRSVVEYADAAALRHPSHAGLRSAVTSVDSEASRRFLIANDVGTLLDVLAQAAVAQRTGDPLGDMMGALRASYAPPTGSVHE